MVHYCVWASPVLLVDGVALDTYLVNVLGAGSVHGVSLFHFRGAIRSLSTIIRSSRSAGAFSSLPALIGGQVFKGGLFAAAPRRGSNR